MRFRVLLLILFCLPMFGQQTATESAPAKSTESAPAKPTGPISTTARLLNAKTVFIKQIAGNELAFDVVNNAIAGWPRYIVVDSMEKADLLIEVSAPAEQKKKDDKTSVQGDSGSGRDPRAMQMPSTTYTDTDVKLIVRDSHTRAVLWAGKEPAREAFRQAKTDENLMAAAQKLFREFHDRVEPPSTTSQ